MAVGVMVTLVAMTVGLMVMLVAVLVFMLAMIMMVVLMLMCVLGSCFVTVEPGHVVVVVLELLCQLNVKVAGVDAMLVCACNGNLKAVDRQCGELLAQMSSLAPRSSRAATVMSPLMPEVPSTISVC